MRTFTIGELVVRHDLERRSQGSAFSPSLVLAEESRRAPTTTTYDIFLSHAYKDAEQILGLAKTLRDMGFSVYVDWIIDTQLSRDSVTPATAARLRRRMKQCRALFYVTSENAPLSRWMPWETGYFDALRGRVAILPVTKEGKSTYQGQEYLGLYPYVLRGGESAAVKPSLLLKLSDGRSVLFKEWIQPERGVFS